MAEARLILTVGSSAPITIKITGESLTGVDQATLDVRPSSGATAVITRTTAAGNLSIDLGAGSLVASITGVEADALVAGTYIGQAMLRYGDADSWRETDPFHVRIDAAIASKL